MEFTSAACICVLRLLQLGSLLLTSEVTLIVIALIVVPLILGGVHRWRCRVIVGIVGLCASSVLGWSMACRCMTSSPARSPVWILAHATSTACSNASEDEEYEEGSHYDGCEYDPSQDRQ